MAFVESDQGRPEKGLSGSVQGILACIEAGLAHLSPEQRQLWESDAQANLLMSDHVDPGANDHA